MGTLIKASSVRQGHQAMRERFGEEAYTKAVSLLPDSDQQLISGLDHAIS